MQNSLVEKVFLFEIFGINVRLYNICDVCIEYLGQYFNFLESFFMLYCLGYCFFMFSC